MLFLWPGRTAWAALVLALVVASVLVADLCLAPRPGRVGVSRALPAVVGMGSGAVLSWTVHNPLPRPLVVRIADELAPSLGASARRARARVAPGRSVTLSATIRPTRRGRFNPVEIVVRAEAPWA